MTHFTRSPLCSFPASSKSFNQACKVKELLNKTIGRVDGASLLIVADPHERTHRLELWHDAQDATASAWAKEAQEAVADAERLVLKMGQRELVR